MDYTRYGSCLYGRIRHKLEYCYKLKNKRKNGESKLGEGESFAR